MNLDGTYTFVAPQEVVWAALLDPEVLARVMPGCERLEKTGDNSYEGTIKVQVGPIKGQFQGKVTLAQLNPPNSYVMKLTGRGPAGLVDGEGRVKLEPQNGATMMRYAGKVQVGGRLAGVGQRLLNSSAKAITRQSLDGLNRQIQARLMAKPEELAVTAVDTPAVQGASQTEFAVGVAKNLLDDLIPRQQRPTIIAVGLGILLFIVYLNWWSTNLARKIAKELKALSID